MEIPLPCEDDSSSYSSSYSSSSFIDKNSNSNSNSNSQSMKLILDTRIDNSSTIIFNNNIIQKCKLIQEYTLYPTQNGYLLFYLKKDNTGMIDFNHYIHHHHGKFEMIFIKKKYIQKMIDEDFNIQLYLQTLLKNDYTKITATPYILYNQSLLKNISLCDTLFYASQLFLLFR